MVETYLLAKGNNANNGDRNHKDNRRKTKIIGCVTTNFYDCNLSKSNQSQPPTFVHLFHYYKPLAHIEGCILSHFILNRIYHIILQAIVAIIMSITTE